jgi:hypothetical protein
MGSTVKEQIIMDSSQEENIKIKRMHPTNNRLDLPKIIMLLQEGLELNY